ncbi:hypothetical protein [Nannocystis pusilla]|uniref:hypothetical protein n=1 Tax=Nannocystis pusilla TaxID=889268 RepID=UPI003B7C1027
MIRDLEEFRRLFRLHIPAAEHLAYYLDTLARSPQYADLPALAGRFAAFEERLAAQDLSVADYRQQQLLALRDELAATAALPACAPPPSARRRRPAIACPNRQVHGSSRSTCARPISASSSSSTTRAPSATARGPSSAPPAGSTPCSPAPRPSARRCSATSSRRRSSASSSA